MDKKESVFELVKLMSKAEKRNFKLFATRLEGNEEAKFLSLFNCLDSMENYSEKKVLACCPSITKQQLPNHKAHLYRQVLKSLRMLNVQHSIVLQIREQIDFAQILFDKGLYNQADKILQKIKAIALETDQLSAILDITNLYRQIKVVNVSSEMTYVAEQTARSTEQISSQLANQSALQVLSVQCYALHHSLGFARSQKDLDQLKNYFKPRIDVYEGQKLSFTELFYFYQAKGWYSYISHNTILSYRYARKWIELFSKNQAMKEILYDSYLRGYAQVLDGIFLMRRYSLYIRTLEEFENESKKVGTINDNALMISQQILFTGRLNKCIMDGTYKDGLWLTKSIDSYMKKYSDRLTIHEKMALDYKVALLYFGDGNQLKCIEYLAKIIAIKEINTRRDLQCYARMLNLIALYDAGIDFNLDYQVRSVYSFVVKMREMTDMKKELYTFFKRLGSVAALDMKQEFKTLYDHLKPYEKHRYERRTFYYIDILSWLESKITGRSLGDIVRSKFEKIMRTENKKYSKK